MLEIAGGILLAAFILVALFTIEYWIVPILKFFGALVSIGLVIAFLILLSVFVGAG